LGDGAAVLKDLGFTVDVRSDELGLYRRVEEGDAYNVGEIAAAAATAVVSQAAALGSGCRRTTRTSRCARRSSPRQAPRRVRARVTLQRVVWDTEAR
jgi:hypothetical protein